MLIPFLHAASFLYSRHTRMRPLLLFTSLIRPLSPFPYLLLFLLAFPPLFPQDAVESRFRRVLSFLDEKNASDAPVPELSGGEGSSSYSYARVRDRLERISKGEYVLQTPQVQLVGGGGAAVQEEAVPTAAAAGAVVVGNGGGKQAQQWGGGAAAEQRWS